MNYTLVDFLSYAIGIGALLGLWRMKQIDRSFLPFVALLCLGLLNEILSTIFIEVFHSNVVNSNIYVLAEALLIMWLFRNWGLFGPKKKFFVLWLSVIISAWLIDNFFIGSIFRFNSYFRILYSFIIVLMSIHKINSLMVAGEPGLVKNSQFIISMGFIVFFTYKALVEIFWVYGLNASRDFRVEVYRIMTYINLVVNLLFAAAILWIPKKRESLLS